VEAPPGVHGEGNFLREALSLPSALCSGPAPGREIDNFSRERRSADLRRRFGAVSGYWWSEIFLAGDVLATVAASREALVKKNEAAISFLLTDRDDFDK